MKCLNCSSDYTKYLFYSSCYITNKKFKLFECSKCFSLFLSPQPKNLNKFYPKNYRKYKPLVNKILNLKYYLFCFKINKIFKNTNKKILEIGCGNGQMLSIFKKLGWKVFGIERDVNLNKKLNITNKKINKFNNNMFNLILMHNSLEHLKKPSFYLRNAIKKIKKNGRLIITVPNYNSLQFKIGNDQWLHLDTPRHLCIFSQKFFENFFKKYKNISSLKITPCSFELEFYGWLQTIDNFFLKEKNKIFKLLMNIESSKTSLILGTFRFAIITPIALLLTIFSMLINQSSTIKIIVVKK